MSNTDPHVIFDALRGKMKTKRSLSSLEAIHEICREHKDAGSTDFRVATIARLGAARGVPSEQTIKNTTGEAYRVLINTWQESVPKREQKKTSVDWVSEIRDARLRFLVEDLVVKNKKLERQIRVLKQVDINIDLRDTVITQGLPNLIDSEIDALKAAISADFFEKKGWKVDSRGRVTDSQGNKIYNPGYVTAIEKLLSLALG